MATEILSALHKPYKKHSASLIKPFFFELTLILSCWDRTSSPLFSSAFSSRDCMYVMLEVAEHPKILGLCGDRNSVRL
jgi:hypothetical protein